MSQSSNSPNPNGADKPSSAPAIQPAKPGADSGAKVAHETKPVVDDPVVTQPVMTPPAR